MFKNISNNRFYNIFLFPLTLGSLSVVSFEPISYTFVNFLTLPLFFLILLNIKKNQKVSIEKNLTNLTFFVLGYFLALVFF